MSLLWSAQQHAWLKALGHRVYVQSAVVLEESRAEMVAAPARQPPVAAPPVRRRLESAAVEPVREVSVAPSRPASRLPDKLHFALIRASGCNPNAPEAAAIMAQWPASAELRGNPAAKRALWPRLRALRRSVQP